MYLRAAKRYGIAAASCLVFSLVYAQFSHGVASPFMTWLFLVPLLGGLVPSLALAFAGAHRVPDAARGCWALCIATLATASMLQGIFEIAGTSSPLIAVYLAAALVLAVAALVFLLASRRTRT